MGDVPAIALKSLSKSFGYTRAVYDLSLSIPSGTFYALLGPNGAGKTTTLRMIAGLLKPDKGDTEILGLSVARYPEAAKRVLAYLPDDPPLYAKLYPLEYLEFVAGLWGMPAGEAQSRAEALLKSFDLWDRSGILVEGFSRGMRQKLALAGALIHEPRVFILDEPLTGLDAEAARQVKDILLDYVRRGNTVVLTTHILEVAERLAERIGIIAKGKLLAEGTLEELRDKAGGKGSGEATLEEVFLELVSEAKP